MLAGDQPGQILGLLLRIAPAAQLVDAQVGVRAVRQPQRGARAADLFHRDDMLKIAQAQPAVFLAHRDAVQAELAHLRPQLDAGTSRRRRSSRRSARSCPQQSARWYRGSCPQPRRARSRNRGAWTSAKPLKRFSSIERRLARMGQQRKIDIPMRFILDAVYDRTLSAALLPRRGRAWQFHPRGRKLQRHPADAVGGHSAAGGERGPAAVPPHRTGGST